MSLASFAVTLASKALSSGVMDIVIIVLALDSGRRLRSALGMNSTVSCSASCSRGPKPGQDQRLGDSQGRINRGLKCEAGGAGTFRPQQSENFSNKVFRARELRSRILAERTRDERKLRSRAHPNADSDEVARV